MGTNLLDGAETCAKTSTASAAPDESLDSRLLPLIQALSSQQEALAQLTNLGEQHGELIGGLMLVLRALMDLLLDDEQRAELQARLARTPPRSERQARRSVVDSLLG
jgi:hypothetical protein